MDELEDLNRPEVLKIDWMNDKHMELVTAETIDRVIDECIESGLYAWDIETTGLDNRVFYGSNGTPYTTDKIVGHCLSPDGQRGYYIPVRHMDHGNPHEANVSITVANRALRRLADSEARAIFHHGKFDIEFLEFAEGEPIGCWDNPGSWEDTHILAYLRNTRERRKGLKFLSNQELGLQMIELKELFPPEEAKKGYLNFSTLDPKWDPCLWYACSDAICTRLLYDLLHPGVMSPEPHGQSQETIYKVEKMCVPATRWMERCRINIDREKIEELIRLGQEEWFESLEAVYAEASKILNRDIRPGWFRVMTGVADVPGNTPFDHNCIDPNYMGIREEAKKQAKQHKLDPMEPDAKGKERVQTVTKEVPTLVNPKQKERVPFPLVYDVTIPAQLGSLMRELGVRGLKATEKSGQVVTRKEELDRVLEAAGDKFPFMGKVKRFRETAKALSTNLFPIWYDTTPERAPDGCVWVGFNGHKVDTGRFSTPQPRSKGYHGQVRWNLHSIPATYDKKKPACMLRIREAIKARPGFILAAIDYSGVELRIVTNYSREPKWLAEFFRCSGCEHKFDRGQAGVTPDAPPPFCPECGSDKIGDLHTLTAISIYGEGIVGTKDFKNKRQKSKALNFAMCYGGGGLAAQRAVDVDKDEGWRIKRQFDGSYTGLRGWWEMQHRFGKKYEYVTTAFGRRYPVPDITHETRWIRAKAERNAVNGPVQGASADIMKLAMSLLFKEFKKRGWLLKVLMTITIHDELVFEIAEDLAEEAIDVIVPIMTRAKPFLRLKWPVPLKVDVEIGDDWTVPHNLVEMEHNQADNWTPKLVRVFPTKYAHYLKCGGKPLEGVETPDVPDRPDTPDDTPGDTVQGPASASKIEKVAYDAPKTGKGKVHIHIIQAEKLSYGLMERLAHIIHQVEGRGLETLKVVTDQGDVLWEEETLISATAFTVLAGEYNV